MAIDLQHPVNAIGDFADDTKKDVRHACDLARARFRQVRRTRRKQHLGRENEPVADNAHALFLPENVPHPPEEIRAIFLQILLFGGQPLGLGLQQRGALLLGLTAAAFLGGNAGKRGVEFVAERLQLHLRIGFARARIIEQGLQFRKLRAKRRDLAVEQCLFALCRLGRGLLRGKLRARLREQRRALLCGAQPGRGLCLCRAPRGQCGHEPVAHLCCIERLGLACGHRLGQLRLQPRDACLGPDQRGAGLLKAATCGFERRRPLFGAQQRLRQLAVQILLRGLGGRQKRQRLLGTAAFLFQCQCHRGQLRLCAFQPSAKRLGRRSLGQPRRLFLAEPFLERRHIRLERRLCRARLGLAGAQIGH